MKRVNYYFSKVSGVDISTFGPLHRFASKSDCISEVEKFVSLYLKSHSNLVIVGEYVYERCGYFHQICVTDNSSGRFFLIEILVDDSVINIH